MGQLTIVAPGTAASPESLSYAAWSAIDSARWVLTDEIDLPVAEAARAAGRAVERLTGGDLAAQLAARASEDQVVWLGELSPDVVRAVATRTGIEPRELRAPHAVPGLRLLEAVAVMDQLRSAGGCPWSAAQTHESLAPYLAEESAETLEAIASGDRQHLSEELGDVLFQVLFHARVAQDAPTQAEQFDIDQVSDILIEKLKRRTPHVFGTAQARTAEEAEALWMQRKAAELAE